MKIQIVLLSLVVASVSNSQVPTPKPKLETPMVTARTSNSSRKDVKSVSSEGWNQKQTVRSIGVDVEYRFLHAPPSPVEIQCFFIAKDEATKTRFVFDYATSQSKDQAGHFTFNAPPLMGLGKKWINIPFYGSTNRGEAVGGFLTFSSPINGSKIEGWIVRFVEGDAIVKIESNQPHLSTLAKDSQKLFDAIASKNGK